MEKTTPETGYKKRQFSQKDDVQDGGSSSSTSKRSRLSDTAAGTREHDHNGGRSHRNGSHSGGGSSSSSGSGSASPSKEDARSKVSAGRAHCYDQPVRRETAKCLQPKSWQDGRYVKDECGSGIVPRMVRFQLDRINWCRTPLTMYQATIGELGRQILCRETIITRDIKPEPPCNVSEYILPLCRGYYRKKDCLRPCEEEYATYKQGRKVYRDRVERYWQPCMTKEEKVSLDVNAYAPHNVALGLKIKRKLNDVPCW